MLLKIGAEHDHYGVIWRGAGEVFVGITSVRSEQ